MAAYGWMRLWPVQTTPQPDTPIALVSNKRTHTLPSPTPYCSSPFSLNKGNWPGKLGDLEFLMIS